MLRKLVILLLLVPLPLNGLWMVCQDASPDTKQSTQISADSEENLFDLVADESNANNLVNRSSAAGPIKKCITRSIGTGSICLFFESGARSSMTIVFFGPTMAAPRVEIPFSTEAVRLSPAFPDLYVNPSLPFVTPPPRA